MSDEIKKPRKQTAAPKKTTSKTTRKKTAAPKQEAVEETQGSFALAMNKHKMLIAIIAAATALLMILSIVLGVVFGLKSCKKDEETELPPLQDVVRYDYSGTTQVGYYGEVLGTVERVKPVEEIKDGGLASGYPSYGSTLRNVIGTDADKVAARNALISESSFLTATGTSNAGGGGYTYMDENGYLYSGTVNDEAPTHALEKDGVTYRQLYKHSASVGLYLGDVSDDEPALVKEVSFRPRGYNGYGVTGLYAPAGEVIKIQISEADMNATGGLTVHIGQALYNGQANNIWAAKNQMQRIPHLLNTMNVNKNTATLKDGVYTAYVGSFIGGPIYIRNENVSFTATISGGVAYRHFILGYTTEEEFEQNSKSSAPYFDLEVWDRGVLHSGPLNYAKRYSYDDLYEVAVLWDKVATVTTYNSNQGIVFLYDPFVAAGAAVAFPGRSSVNCPMSWMSDALNYNGIVTSGSWGNFHEYHHNFQGYGVGNGGEVTNNALTLVSYSLFTKISSKRGHLGFGSQGLGGWNSYTSATYALEETLKIARPNQNPSNGNQGLALYATLLHNFGADNFIKTKAAGGGQSYTAYMNAWQKITHNNMYYYFNEILKGGVTNNADPSYPMFVPVSCLYQTGRSYMYDGKKQYFDTMQPYVIPYGEPFDMDLTPYPEDGGMSGTGSIVIPDGFTYSVKSVTQPENGSVSIIDGQHLRYVPDVSSNSLKSGKFNVTLKIEKDDRSFAVDDVDLVIEFEQTHETTKTTLERTTYTYKSDKMYTDAVEAYESGFAGYSNKVQFDHSNPTQNSNTDIWYYPDTDEYHNAHPDAPDHHFFSDNTVEVIEGKLYMENEGKYRVYLRGRVNCAVYYSTDGGRTFKLGASVKNGSGDKFYGNDENTYFDISVGDGPNDEVPAKGWVYFREVLIVEPSQRSYIGLGMKQWTDPMFTIVEKYYDSEGNEVDADSEDIAETETLYYDYQGNPVTEQEVLEAALIPPVITNNTQPYVTAYRNSYEFPDNSRFQTDYFYVRDYGYTYNSDAINGVSIVGDPKCPDNFPIENLFDDDPNTVCASPAVVSNNAPWEITVDMGEVVEANRFELTGYKYNNNSNKNQTPNSITLYLGETLENMKEVASFDNGTVSGIKLAFNFDTTTFRYYKLVVRGTVEGRYAAIGNIDFFNNVSGGKLIHPSSESVTFRGEWEVVQTQSTFGHVYAGEEGATLTFDFEGTRFGFLSSSAFGKDFEVYVDGEKIESINLKDDDGAYYASFLSEKLKSGRHYVELKCTGSASIDSVIIYP